MTLSRKEAVFLAAMLVYSGVATFGGLFRVVELLGVAPAIVPENPRAAMAPLLISMHILGSFVFCLAGALQFLPQLRVQMPRWHRRLGYTVAVSGGASALTGLWMTFFFAFPPALQGPLLYGARVFFGSAMVCLIAAAIAAAREGQFIEHAAAMMRAYAIGQGASTQAALGLIFVLLFGHEPSGFVRDGVMVSAWLLNLLAAQVIIHRMRLNAVTTPRNAV